jgi:hypothetical protein
LTAAQSRLAASDATALLHGQALKDVAELNVRLVFLELLNHRPTLDDFVVDAATVTPCAPHNQPASLHGHIASQLIAL